MGVMELYDPMPPARNGICHSSFPSAAPTPTTDFSVSATICFTPSTVISTGEA